VPQVVDEDFGVWVQLLVPLHVRVMQVVEVQVTPVPWHTPPVQMSPYVHRLPSSQAAAVRHAHVPPALVQLYVVPPQVRVWQAVEELQV
jgi:hypothetical protein